jgi:hypothetical protein
MQTHDGKLFVGGNFDHAGTLSTANLAAWTGTAWTNGPGVDESVEAFVRFGPPGQEQLVAGGMFQLDGQAEGLARLVDGAWQPITGGPNFWVAGLGVTNVSGTPELIISAGFVFGQSGYVAKYDGAAWSGMARGLISIADSYADFDDGSGLALYANMMADGLPFGTFLSRWDGRAWSAPGNDTRLRIAALKVFDDGHGPGLFTAGEKFSSASAYENIAVLRGGAWSHVGAGVQGAVNALAVFDDGFGPKLYAAGVITSAGGLPASGIASWDGTRWAAVAGGIGDGEVRTLEVFDADGPGPGRPELYAAGQFTLAGGFATRNIARLVPGCAADFNSDGQADFFDYLDFISAFDAQDDSADFDHDGTIDFFDYLDFAQAFDAGC